MRLLTPLVLCTVFTDEALAKDWFCIWKKPIYVTAKHNMYFN